MALLTIGYVAVITVMFNNPENEKENSHDNYLTAAVFM